LIVLGERVGLDEARRDPGLGGGNCERAGWRVPVQGDEEARSLIFNVTRHLRATLASPWPDAAARRRFVSADATAEPDKCDSRRKARRRTCVIRGERRGARTGDAREEHTHPRICGW
jgi:hypothetical protein